MLAVDAVAAGGEGSLGNGSLGCLSRVKDVSSQLLVHACLRSAAQVQAQNFNPRVEFLLLAN